MSQSFKLFRLQQIDTSLDKGQERLSDRRVAEALETGADVLAVSCPYEVPRFEDSLKVLGGDDRMVVRDVMELVAEALGD